MSTAWRPRRQRAVAGIAILAALVSSAGVAAARFVKSPEELRASAAPPPPTVLTATVQRRILASTIVTRGTVTAAKRIEVTPVVAGVAAQIVTGTYAQVGAEIRLGDVLLAISGRPLIVLAGDVPGYRDLKPGTSGDDVRQLQAALKALGHYRGGDPAGYLGMATKSAIRSLYTKIRYDVPDTGGPGGYGDQEALRAAEDRVSAAQHSVGQLEHRIATGGTAGPGDEPLGDQLEQARLQVRRAQEALSTLVARTGPMLPLAEFVFMPEATARVTSISAKTGQMVKSPLITLAAGPLSVIAKLRSSDITLLKAGMPVHITSETLAEQAEGSIELIGAQTIDTADGGGGPYHPLIVKPSKVLGALWADLDVRVTIKAAQTADTVLVVPLSAISAGADARTTVTVLDGTGNATQVEVRTGASGDGFAEVSPISGSLHEGDRVIVGRAS